MLVCFHWAHSTLNGPFKIWLVFVIFDSNCPPSLAHTENLVAFVISAEYELVESKNYAMHGNPIIFKDNRDQKIQWLCTKEIVLFGLYVLRIKYYFGPYILIAVNLVYIIFKLQLI